MKLASSPHSWRHRQHGAATLVVTLVLFFVMTLIAAYANRNHLFEQRASLNQYRATQAFEAAEAGAEWALAMLNDPRGIDEHCLPSPSATTSFRERYLVATPGSGLLSPATWNNAGAATSLRAMCVRGSSGWDCSCPAAGMPTLNAPSAGVVTPAFMIEFIADAHPRVLPLQATGCASLGGPCSAGVNAPTDATSRVQVHLGLLPGLHTRPVAALTTRGDVQAGGAAVGFHQPGAAAGGFTVHAGGNVHAPAARLSTAAGALASASVIEGDASLAGMPAERLFAAFFGMDKGLWTQHPGVRHIQCPSDCTSTLLEVVTSASSNPMVWVDGDLNLQGPVGVGTRDRPVIVIASGTARFVGAVMLHGLVYANGLAWEDTGSGSAWLRGAAVSEASYQGDGAPDFIYDPVVLDALVTRSGSFARLPGGWKDF